MDSVVPSHAVSEGNKDATRNWANGSECYSSEEKGFPQWKYYSSEEKVVLAVRSQGIPQSHTVHNKSGFTQIYGERHKRVAIPAQTGSSKEVSGRQAYIGFLGTDVGSGFAQA